MDLKLTEEELAIQEKARDFARREIEPIAAEIDRTGKLPPDLADRFGQAGLLGMKVPKEYGGLAVSCLSWVLAVEQVSYPASACSSLMATSNSVAEAIARFGTEAQKRRYLRPLCRGDEIGSLAFTEPATGSDPRALETTATLDGDDYVINGTKRFITNAAYPGPAIVFAKTSPDAVTAIIVDKNCPGYSIPKQWELMGLHGQQVMDISFQGVRASRSNLLGEPGKGYQLLLQMVSGGKLGICAEAVALAQAALDEALKFARQRTRRGSPIASMQAIQWLLAEMASRVEAARWLTYRVAWLKDQSVDVLKESAQAKLFAGHTAVEVASMSMQVHGSYGYTREYKIERIYRQAKTAELLEGTNEVQRTIVAASLLAQA